jgi:hypothetical protein
MSEHVLTAKERIIEILENRPEGQCDDCLSEIANIRPRQQVNSICRDLTQRGKLRRESAICPECKRQKILNTIIGLNKKPQPDEIFKVPEVRENEAQHHASFRSAAESLDSIRRKLIEIMNQLDPLQNQRLGNAAREGFSDRLTRLADSGIIPTNIMIIMRMLNAMRNAAVYHECQFEAKEEELSNLAYQIVIKWCRKR